MLCPPQFKKRSSNEHSCGGGGEARAGGRVAIATEGATLATALTVSGRANPQIIKFLFTNFFIT